jgi:peptidoglycan/xylan/chitin deacetylase (PgdA/CDA1 family)
MTDTDPRAWAWPEEVWRGHVDRIRAGRDLTPATWPNGARAVVTLSFDPDHETLALRDGDTSPGSLARGEFGSRVGSRRVLQVLEEHAAPATFFIPAVSALLHPQEMKAYRDAGHEIGAHGWIHERTDLLNPAEEREVAHRSMDAVEKLLGVRPRGIRTPSADFTPITIDVFHEVGLEYDSSLMADDMPYEILANGSLTGIVEIPMEWIRDDAPYFMMQRYGPLRPYTTPRAWLTIMKDEFDSAYADGGVFQLVCHPHIIGQRSRIVVLRELLAYISGHSDVWFASHGELADYVREQHQLPLHPAHRSSSDRLEGAQDS